MSHIINHISLLHILRFLHNTKEYRKIKTYLKPVKFDVPGRKFKTLIWKL